MTETNTKVQSSDAPLWLKVLAVVLLAPILWIAILVSTIVLIDWAHPVLLMLTAAVPTGIVVWITLRRRLSTRLTVLLLAISLTGYAAGTVAWNMAIMRMPLQSPNVATPQMSPPRLPPPSVGAPAPPMSTSPLPPPPASGPAPRERPAASASPIPPAPIPEFPMPPPAASASYVLPRSLFPSQSTVGDVVAAIISALERTGYVDRSFRRTEANGVALITRLERINEDGSPVAENERWPVGRQATQNLAQFFRGLFFVDPGRYRVIVFILQDLPFSQSSAGVTSEIARTWLQEGANVLPVELAQRPFGQGNCTVLIYEFASDGNIVRVVESRMTGKQHLEKTGVWAVLEKGN